MPRVRENRGSVLPCLPVEQWQPALPALPAAFHLSPPPLLATISQQGQQGITHLLNQLGNLLDHGARDEHGNKRVESPAGKLRRGLLNSSIQACDWKSALGLLQFGGVVAAAGNLLSPAGPGGCDHNALERCANCATSVPYVVVGLHAMKERRTASGKAWGASMCAVGLASTSFHASSGKLRTWTRRADYWSIAASSSLLLRAVYPSMPLALTAASIMATPFKPFLVSFVNSSLMEAKFLYRAHKSKDENLKRSQQVHAATSLLGLCAFALEEVMPELPLVHAAWHCMSATAVATVNNLLDDVERSHGLVKQ